MCGSQEQLNSKTSAPSLIPKTEAFTKNMGDLTETIETENSFSPLLETAANNDIEAFKKLVEANDSSIDEAGLWYTRHKSSKQMVLEQRTPLMVASLYGSLDILKQIILSSKVDVNTRYGLDKSTALHCAASGGFGNSVEVVKLLLLAGADTNSVDSEGHRPFDVISVNPKLPESKITLQKLLKYEDLLDLIDSIDSIDSKSSSPSLSSSPETGSSEKKEYPIDPSIPDIKNSIYGSDEFRMFSFKVRPCSRAYSHDWTECPFVHPGENARRRDPRKFHYSCVPCPEFRKGVCSRGDLCEYAHGVFECWLHPAQYRTRLCKDGVNCMRRVCFFAHTPDELRPLFNSAAPSPRAATVMDMTAAMNFPGSPSSPYSPPMSPSSLAWAHPTIPNLQLPFNNRLRLALNAREIAASEELHMLQDIEMLNELTGFSPRHQGGSMRLKVLPKSNLDELFSKEVSSPRYLDQEKQQNVLSYGGRGVSPQSIEALNLNSRLSSFAHREKRFQQLRSLSARNLGSNSPHQIESQPLNFWGNWESPNGKLDWSVQGDDLGLPRKVTAITPNGLPDSSSMTDHAVLSTWVEQMNLDHLLNSKN